MQTSLRLGPITAFLMLASASLASAQSLDAGTPSLDAGTSRSDAGDAGTAQGPWIREGLAPLPPPKELAVPDDEDVAFIVGDGIGGWAFGECTSEAPGQASVADDRALPVGDGRTLACTTYNAPAFVTHMVQAQDDTLYCLKGAAVAYRTLSDPRLRVRVTETSATGPWTLQATSDTPWIVQPVSFAVGVVWPVWLELKYQVVDIAPAGATGCDGVL